MDLINKALQLYDEIESRQKELREILTQLQSMYDARCTMHDEQCMMPDEQESDDSADVSLASTAALIVDASTAEGEELSVNKECVDVEESPSCIVHRASCIENKRPDLWKSLTINDRFRFRRELFAGDDAAMSEAINRLSEMNSLSEADDYLSTMPWESDSEAVGEFMTILSNHFSRF